MYGWLDDQITRVLQVGFKALADDLGFWRRLFPPYVSEAARDELHGLAQKTAHRVAFMHGTEDKIPLVTVEVTDGGSPDFTPFAYLGEAGTADLALRETVAIRIMASTKQELRALSLAVRCALLSHMKLFLDDWEYDSFAPLGASAARQNREYFPEQFGGFMLTQAWGTRGTLEVPLLPSDVTATALLIAHERASVPDGDGGLIFGGAHPHTAGGA